MQTKYIQRKNQINAYYINHYYDDYFNLIQLPSIFKPCIFLTKFLNLEYPNISRYELPNSFFKCSWICDIFLIYLLLLFSWEITVLSTFSREQLRETLSLFEIEISDISSIIVFNLVNPYFLTSNAGYCL